MDNKKIIIIAGNTSSETEYLLRNIQTVYDNELKGKCALFYAGCKFYTPSPDFDLDFNGEIDDKEILSVFYKMRNNEVSILELKEAANLWSYY